jgi:hypothetical protein
VREGLSEDWELEELARHIIFLEAQAIEDLTREIQYDIEILKKLAKSKPFFYVYSLFRERRMIC